jgi:hypothetical protein
MSPGGQTMAAEVGRLVALGASNLTRGFMSVVSIARAVWGPEVQILAALGHGRSYGARSRVGFRALPGILESGLWSKLDSLPKIPIRAIVTDVGNDILYGYSAEETLAWVEEALKRLQQLTRDITLTDLPLISIRRLSQARFIVFRSILFPSSRLSLGQVLERAERVVTGLARLAADRGVRLFHLDPAWYGFDPIHIRSSLCRLAWQEILDIHPMHNRNGRSLIERLRLRCMCPERRWLFGVEQHTPQSGVALPLGGRVWLY